MSNLTLDDITQRALSLGIITPVQLQEMWTSFGTQNIDAELFLQETVRQGFLTNYQVERLMSGETTGFYFGDYKVLYHIGAGTFARVYRATHKTSGKIVAVKVLRARFYDNQEIINHFAHEAELGIELRHPNIVPIFEVKSEDRLHFMVMDFIEGQTLRDFLKIRKKVDPKITTRIIMDICSGLDYAAKRGLQHRDLKLSNVLLSSMGKAMLVDFGLAAISENTDLTSAEIRNQRSIDYAALERTTGVKRDDKRSDIYFLGCIYYHLLTGEAPLFETKDRSKRLDKNRFYNVKPIQNIDPSIPRAVTLVVNKAMSMDVTKRYQSMGEMYADLEVCARRLADGTANEGITSNQIDVRLVQVGTTVPKEKQKSVMIVDSNVELQGIFRESLKKDGYRVLVASSAERAVDRLLDDVSVADIVIFNAQSLGEAALTGFNTLAQDNYTKGLPQILLIEDKQADFVKQVERSDNRMVLLMPITMKILKENLGKLLGILPVEPTPQVAAQVSNLTNILQQPTEDNSVEKNIEDMFSSNALHVDPSKVDSGESDEEPNDDHIFDDDSASESMQENNESQGADSDPQVEFDDDEEEEEEDDDDIAPVKKPFGYKEALAERSGANEDEKYASIADAILESAVPSLLKKAGGEPEELKEEIVLQQNDLPTPEELKQVLFGDSEKTADQQIATELTDVDEAKPESERSDQSEQLEMSELPEQLKQSGQLELPENEITVSSEPEVVAVLSKDESSDTPDKVSEVDTESRTSDQEKTETAETKETTEVKETTQTQESVIDEAIGDMFSDQESQETRTTPNENIQKLHDQLNELKTQLESANEALKNHEKNFAASQESETELKTQLEDAEKQKSENERKLESAKADKEQFEIRRRTASEALAETKLELDAAVNVRSQADESVNKVSELKSKIDSLTEEYNKATTEAETTLIAASETREEAIALAEKYRQKESEFTGLAELLQSSSIEAEAANDFNVEAKRKVEELRFQVEAAQNEATSKRLAADEAEEA
ncbi:MAG: protein kinase domain-containing protein, partial [Thermoguttaceae bacterium]